jgi:hypothetical protein
MLKSRRATEIIISRDRPQTCDYLLRVARMHMQPDAKPHRLTVADIAQCLGKTCGQLTHAVEQLTAEDLVAIEAYDRKRSTSGDHRVVLPTSNALRKLPYFSEWDQASLRGGSRPAENIALIPQDHRFVPMTSFPSSKHVKGEQRGRHPNIRINQFMQRIAAQ